MARSEWEAASGLPLSPPLPHKYMTTPGMAGADMNLTWPADILRALQGCRRVYFGMTVSAPYPEARFA